jgi:microcystin-dependent protein
MSEPFVGEIRMFAGNFAPRGWAFCDGQLLAVSQNDALFSLLGTIYGGDGRTTFGLPDMRGRLPVHFGSGPGLTPRNPGAKFGAEAVILTGNQMPAHNHDLLASNSAGLQSDPDDAFLASSPNVRMFRPQPTTGVILDTGSISPVGGNQSHSNVMPFLCVHFIIALVGIYPSRS